MLGGLWDEKEFFSYLSLKNKWPLNKQLVIELLYKYDVEYKYSAVFYCTIYFILLY